MVPSHARLLRHRVNTSYHTPASLTLIIHGSRSRCILPPPRPGIAQTTSSLVSPSLLLHLCSTDKTDVMTTAVTPDRSHSNSPPSKPKHMATHSLFWDKKCVKIRWLCDVECNIFMTAAPHQCDHHYLLLNVELWPPTCKAHPHNMHSRDHVKKCFFGPLMVYICPNYLLFLALLFSLKYCDNNGGSDAPAHIPTYLWSMPPVLMRWKRNFWLSIWLKYFIKFEWTVSRRYFTKTPGDRACSDKNT